MSTETLKKHERLTMKNLKACEIGRRLAKVHGLDSGTWSNIFVANMAREIIRLRRLVRRGGQR